MKVAFYLKFRNKIGYHWVLGDRDMGFSLDLGLWGMHILVFWGCGFESRFQIFIFWAHGFESTSLFWGDVGLSPHFSGVVGLSPHLFFFWWGGGVF